MCGGVFAHVVDDTEQLRRKITVRKTPLEPVGSSGVFRILSTRIRLSLFSGITPCLR